MSDPRSIPSPLEQALATARSGRVETAVAALLELAERDPSDPLPPYHAALLQYRTGGRAAALALMETAARRQPGFAPAWHALGILRLEAGEEAAAITAFQAAVRAQPGHLEAHINLAALFRRRRQLARAIGHYRTAARLRDQDPGRWFALGLALYEAGEMIEAAAAFETVRRLDPARTDAAFNLGIVLPLLGRLEEAVEAFAFVLEREPDNAGALTRLARLQAKAGRRDTAEALLRRAVAAAPQQPEAHRELGLLADLAGRPEEAARCFQTLVRLDPENLADRYRLGRLLAELGRPAEAVEQFRAVLAGEPEFDDALWDLRAALEALGRGEEFAAAYGGAKPLYQDWVERYDTLDDADRAAIRARVAGFTDPPVFSLVMPVHDTDAHYLDQAIGSVRRQLYPHWELCIADDASSAAATHAVLARHAAEDARIRIVWRPDNGHISAASNSALALATGDFVALLDHDDELPEHALYMVAETLLRHPDTDLVYSDEDKIDEAGRRFDAYFKPDWDPDLILGQNLFSHLGVYRRSLVTTVGGFRTSFEGSQDYDLLLRAVERTQAERIRHIPHVLYHWRAIAGSTARGLEAKPYATAAAVRALQEHCTRTGVAAEVSPSRWGYRVRRRLAGPPPRVSVIVPTRDRLELLRACIDGLAHGTDYPDLEILVVDNDSRDPDCLAYLERLPGQGVRVLRQPGGFDFPALNRRGVEAATGSVLCFLNNDVEPATPSWLAELVVHAARPEIGAVGAKLMYGDGLVQHAGIVLGYGLVAGHAPVRIAGSDGGYYGQAQLVRRVSAVTGACMALRRDVFEAAGGFDPALKVDFNDIDLCLRIGRLGYGVLWTPHALLYHHESASRGSFMTPEKQVRYAAEAAVMQERWGAVLENDPCYNPNLTLADKPFRPAFPPRSARPWRGDP